LLALFFASHIRKKLPKKILTYLPIVFIAYCIFDFLVEKEPAIPFSTLVIEYIVLTVFIVYFFFETMQEAMVIEPIYHKSIFWICVAFILNFSGLFFLFLFSKYTVNDDLFKKQFTIIYSTVTIIKNLLLCLSIVIRDEHNQVQSGRIDTTFDRFQYHGDQN